MNWVYHTAVEQLAALSNGDVTAVALLEQSIEQAEQLRPVLNPIALPLYERARTAALEADKKLERGEGGTLCGLPVTIKDSQWLAGYPCVNGSRSLESFIPDETCAAVDRLEQAGAVIFAKTTCPEFSLSGVTESEFYGRTVNPWDHSRTSGGSSGGAAVAVAAGIGGLSLGGDGGGSIRIPAAFCGVVGFKPTFGLVPREPGFTTWQSIVSYGPLARTVSDAALMFEVLAESMPGTGGNTKLREATLIVSEDLGFAPLDDDVRGVFTSAVSAISATGAHLVFDSPGLDSSASTWAITASYDMWHQKQSILVDPDQVGPWARQFIEFGSTFTEEDFKKAQQHRKIIGRRYESLLRKTGASVMLSPALGCEAFPLGTFHPARIGDVDIEYPWLDWAPFMYDANLAGMPACVIPIGLGDDGLPVSMQIMGLPGEDQTVLSIARKLEKLFKFELPRFGDNSQPNPLPEMSTPQLTAI